MCKPLNPKAPEWKPSTNHRYPPPPPPPPDHHPNPPLPPYHAKGFVGPYKQSTPLCIAGEKRTNGNRAKFAAKKKPEGRRRIRGLSFSPPFHAVMSLPPRLRKAERRFRVANTPPPPPPAREWRPRNSAKPHKDGGAAPLPPELAVSGGSDGNTTLMIKNIPNQLRRDFMLGFLDDYSRTHGLEYDFFYLPMDFRRKDNFGYAFVNFTTSAAALKFKSLLQGFVWGCSFRSNKVCDITWARIQGQKSLVQRFKNSRFTCDQLGYLPVILDPPRNGSDPDPLPPVVLGYLNLSTLKKIG